MSAEELDRVLASVPVQDVWGVRRAYGRRLPCVGVTMALDLTRADLPLRWSFLPRPEVTDFDASYYIALYDEDESGLTPVAATSRFTLREFAAAGFATTYTFENTSDTLSSRVEIRWEE